MDYIRDYLPWRVHHEKGITVTAGSTQLALRRVFATLHISMFFPKVDKNIDGDFENNDFLGFSLIEGHEMTG